jgi:hypothetical protein
MTDQARGAGHTKGRKIKALWSYTPEEMRGMSIDELRYAERLMAKEQRLAYLLIFVGVMVVFIAAAIRSMFP